MLPLLANKDEYKCPIMTKLYISQKLAGVQKATELKAVEKTSLQTTVETLYSVTFHLRDGRTDRRSGLKIVQLNRKCAVKIGKCAVKSYYWCSQFLTTLAKIFGSYS